MTGDQLRRWRRRMGWTQVQAAKELGYSWRHYARMEASAKVSRPVEKLARLIEARDG